MTANAKRHPNDYPVYRFRPNKKLWRIWVGLRNAAEANEARGLKMNKILNDALLLYWKSKPTLHKYLPENHPDLRRPLIDGEDDSDVSTLNIEGDLDDTD